MKYIILMALLSLPTIGHGINFFGSNKKELPKQILTSEFNKHNFKVMELLNVSNIPWTMEFINPDELIVGLKNGIIQHHNLKTKKTTKVFQITDVYDSGQAGLLDIAKSPLFAKNKELFIVYVKEVNGDGATTLAKAQWKNNKITSWKDLLITKSVTGTSRHFGSRITFDDKNHLYFSVGDRGERDQAQDLTNHIGTILRVDLNGQALPDNPFFKHKTYKREIWSYGHRNPQGLYFDQTSKKLWSVEHGPRGGDEINLVKKAKNYGWPLASHGNEYWNNLPVSKYKERPGMENPIKVYTPSIAPCQLISYRGEMFPNWQGKLFVAALNC